MRGLEEAAASPGEMPGEMVSMCTFRAGDGWFGMETGQIREVLGETTPQLVPLAAEYIAGVVPYRGEVLTTVSFRVLLGLEKGAGAACVLVLDDQESDTRFGLMVDGVGGVVTMARDALEPNSSALDARSMALFRGTYRTPSGLMVRLDSQHLWPSRLAQSRLFATLKQERSGVQK